MTHLMPLFRPFPSPLRLAAIAILACIAAGASSEGARAQSQVGPDTPIALVLASTSSESWKGRVILGAEPIKLESGTFIVVVGPDGEIGEITGPHPGSLQAKLGSARPVPNLIRDLGKLYKHLSRHGRSLLTCMGAGAPTKRAESEVIDPATIDLARGHKIKHCRVPNDPLALTNRPSLGGAAWKLRLVQSSMVARLVWPENRETLRFPGQPPPRLVVDGTRFQLEPDEQPRNRKPIKYEIVLHEISDPVRNPGIKALLYAKAGCPDQARAILDTAVPGALLAKVKAMKSASRGMSCPK